MEDTIIVVGVTEMDSYGSLWVTPQGGGDRIKIAGKRERLHPLFEQGKAVLLHWETYMNKPYVADAKPVEGELPPPSEPIEEYVKEVTARQGIAPQEKGMWWKEVGENFRTGLFKKDEGNGALLWRAYITQMLASLEITIERKEE